VYQDIRRHPPRDLHTEAPRLKRKGKYLLEIRGINHGLMNTVEFYYVNIESFCMFLISVIQMNIGECLSDPKVNIKCMNIKSNVNIEDTKVLCLLTLQYLRKNNLKHFFKKKESKSVNSTLSNSDFYTHFINLAIVSDHRVNDSVHEHYVYDIVHVYVDTDYAELDREIACNETKDAERKLKLNKTRSEDYLLNQIFIRCKDMLLPHLYALFNKIFNTDLYPET
jgi:hypothetical protein